MKSNACTVCGGTELNLVDGFYYCVECGTQDQNIQERIVETVVLADGTHAKYTKKKICNTENDKVEMSEEWYKWHAYNFILAGLTDELIAAGANPSVRNKILWIWTRYIKKYQVKQTELIGEFFSSEHKNNTESDEGKQNNQLNKETSFPRKDKVINFSHTCEDVDKDDFKVTTQYEKQCKSNYSHRCEESYFTEDEEFLLDSDEDVGNLLSSDEEDSIDQIEFSFKSQNKKRNVYRIHPLRKGIVIAIFYIALNLDRSPIHLSHLKRLLKSAQIDIKNCTKYIPEDLDIKKIPHFLRFKNSLWNEYSTTQICTIVNSLFSNLELGLPLIPDIRKVIEDFLLELCLPMNFKSLIVSLIHRYPCRYFNVSQQIREFSFIADFETVCMAYVVIALKMCFGLDSDYEVKLTHHVDKINEDNNYPKVFNINPYGETGSTKRLFSFKDWCAYLRTRKMVVSKHNLFMDDYCQTQVADDYVFLEHLQKRNKKKITLGQEISMEIINKIPIEEKVSVIPKNEFNLIDMPMTSATKVILEYIQDPEIQLMLSEDFTQYNVDYVTRDLSLKKNSNEKNNIKGVTLDNKLINKTGPKDVTSFHKTSRECENINVFVKFCENHEYDSLKAENNNIAFMDRSNLNCEKTKTETAYENDNIKDCDKESSNITFSNDRTIKLVDYPNACIYDDDDKSELKQMIDEVSADQQPEPSLSRFSTQDYNTITVTEASKLYDPHDLPQNFDRKAIIDELINIAHQKHNIKPARKRKISKPQNSEKPLYHPKKQKKENTNTYNLLSLYYQRLQEGMNTKNQLGHSSNDMSIPNTNENISNDAYNNIPAEENIEPYGTDTLENSDVYILDNTDLGNTELLSDSDEEYTLPPITSESDILNGQSITELNKAIRNILSRETEECEEPPAKKLKSDKVTLPTDVGEKIFCGDANELKEFPYWIVRFNNMGPRANHVPFNKNLYENFPHSFTFVLHNCAMVIDSCPFLVYRTMYHIEKLIANDLGDRSSLR